MQGPKGCKIGNVKHGKVLVWMSKHLALRVHLVNLTFCFIFLSKEATFLWPGFQENLIHSFICVVYTEHLSSVKTCQGGCARWRIGKYPKKKIGTTYEHHSFYFLCLWHSGKISNSISPGQVFKAYANFGISLNLVTQTQLQPSVLNFLGCHSFFLPAHEN
jgi:hypothetical protein